MIRQLQGILLFDDDDHDHDRDDGELFLWYGWLTKAI